MVSEQLALVQLPFDVPQILSFAKGPGPKQIRRKGSAPPAATSKVKGFPGESPSRSKKPPFLGFLPFELGGGSHADFAAAVITVAAATAAAEEGSLPRNLAGLLSPYSAHMEELGALGKGGFGTVVAVQHRLDGRKLAVKRVPFKSRIPPWAEPGTLERSHAKLLREVHALAELQSSPRVVRYYYGWVEPDWQRLGNLLQTCEITTGLLTQMFAAAQNDGSPMGPLNAVSGRKALPDPRNQHRHVAVPQPSAGPSLPPPQLHQPLQKGAPPSFPVVGRLPRRTSCTVRCLDDEGEEPADGGTSTPPPPLPTIMSYSSSEEATPADSSRTRGPRVTFPSSASQQPIVTMASSTSESDGALPSSPRVVSANGAALHSSEEERTPASNRAKGPRVTFPSSFTHRPIVTMASSASESDGASSSRPGASPLHSRDTQPAMQPGLDSEGTAGDEGVLEIGTATATSKDYIVNDTTANDSSSSETGGTEDVTASNDGRDTFRPPVHATGNGTTRNKAKGLFRRPSDDTLDEMNGDNSGTPADAHAGAAIGLRRGRGDSLADASPSNGRTVLHHPNNTRDDTSTSNGGGFFRRPSSNTRDDASTGNDGGFSRWPSTALDDTTTSNGGGLFRRPSYSTLDDASTSNGGGLFRRPSITLPDEATPVQRGGLRRRRSRETLTKPGSAGDLRRRPTVTLTEITSGDSDTDTRGGATGTAATESAVRSRSADGSWDETEGCWGEDSQPTQSGSDPSDTNLSGVEEVAGSPSPKDSPGSSPRWLTLAKAASCHLKPERLAGGGQQRGLPGAASAKTHRVWPYVLYIAMELVEGGQTLDAFLKQRSVKGLFSDGALEMHIFHQVVEGLAAIHRSGLIHRDLKPSNILLTRNVAAGPPPPPGHRGGSGRGDGGIVTWSVKIGDFGLAVGDDDTLRDESNPLHRSTSATSSSSDSQHTSGVGTASFAAPEQLSGTGLYGPAADLFPLGLILVELLSNFTTGMERAMALRDARERKAVPPAMMRDFPEAAAMAATLLHPDPSARPSAANLLSDPWLSQFSSPPLRNGSAPGRAYSTLPLLTQGSHVSATSAAVAPPHEPQAAVGSHVTAAGAPPQETQAAGQSHVIAAGVPPREAQAAGGSNVAAPHADRCPAAGVWASPFAAALTDLPQELQAACSPRGSLAGPAGDGSAEARAADVEQEHSEDVQIRAFLAALGAPAAHGVQVACHPSTRGCAEPGKAVAGAEVLVSEPGTAHVWVQAVAASSHVSTQTHAGSLGLAPGQSGCMGTASCGNTQAGHPQGDVHAVPAGLLGCAVDCGGVPAGHPYGDVHAVPAGPSGGAVCNGSVQACCARPGDRIEKVADHPGCSPGKVGTMACCGGGCGAEALASDTNGRCDGMRVAGLVQLLSERDQEIAMLKQQLAAATAQLRPSL